MYKYDNRIIGIVYNNIILFVSIVTPLSTCISMYSSVLWLSFSYNIYSNIRVSNNLLLKIETDILNQVDSSIIYFYFII